MKFDLMIKNTFIYIFRYENIKNFNLQVHLEMFKDDHGKIFKYDFWQ